MAEKHNVFISHYGEDEDFLDRLRERLKSIGCEVRNSSIEKKIIGRTRFLMLQSLRSLDPI